MDWGYAVWSQGTQSYIWLTIGLKGSSQDVKILLDCDTGIDDAVAIAYALATVGIEVLGVGSVHGNIESEAAAENTLRLLRIMGREDVPVAQGAHKPLMRPLETATFVHGEDGLGNTYFEPSGLSVSGEHASDQIIRVARENPGQVTLVCTAPLTNIALALLQEPDLPKLIHRVVLMGGTAAEPGNISPVAEANIAHDPEAADIVFSAPWEITMAGLDVTMKTLLREEHLARWREADTPLTRWLLKVLDYYFEFYSDSLGYRACAMHDSVAVGLAMGTVEVLLAPKLPVAVCTSDGPALGQTVVDRRPLVSRGFSAEGAHTQVVMEIESDKFLDDLTRRIASYVAK